MYVPAAFRVEEREPLFDFIEAHGFAAVVSPCDGAPFASHLPLLLDRERGVLQGHLARANPHWQAFGGDTEALVLFHGPHAYISPTWYATAPAVPTWNYAVVHAYGRPQVMSDPEWLIGLLDRLVHKYEAGQASPWRNELPSDFRERLLAAIVGFEIPINRIEGKFKLGQNRSQADQDGMLTHLNAGAPADRALAALMRAETG